ncbi:class I SAM-dependent methyltransferase [Marinomonas polaris]|uniref:class I SAM-dependent methyltransferase n=1 Tax=Marinomonas polaris TaxID=293552 RepID=UPI0035182FE2
MKCKICSKNNDACFTGKILGKNEIEYFYCNECRFLQTEEPYWLNEAYSQSINVSDTGYMMRNLYLSKKLTLLLYFIFGNKGTFLDYAGGYGVFVRMMRDVGYDFYWDDKYTENLFSIGFEWDKSKKIEAVTLFEAFEHFVNPMEEIKSLLEISDTIIFSTELYPINNPNPNEWWYFGLEHGQHISFFSKETFEYIALSFELNYYCMGSLHILTKRKISKWILFSLKFTHLGLHKLVARKLNSKTWDDHELMKKRV